MAKVTEQDLIDRGFKFIREGYFLQKFNHKILGEIEISVIFNYGINIVNNQFDIDIDYPLHDNLDLFIRFAKGQKIC